MSLLFFLALSSNGIDSCIYFYPPLQVQYRLNEERHILLPVPLELAVNAVEVSAYEVHQQEREKKEKETGVKVGCEP